MRKGINLGVGDLAEYVAVVVEGQHLHREVGGQKEAECFSVHKSGATFLLSNLLQGLKTRVPLVHFIASS